MDVDRDRPKAGRVALFVVGLIAVVAGFVTLGTLTSPEPQAALTSTTSTTIEEVRPPLDLENFSVSQIEQGVQLDWELLAGMDRGYPLALTEHDGLLYLFARGLPPSEQGGGLLVWRSSDGSNWDRIGESIGQEFDVAQVASTPRGLIAAGTRPGEPSLVVWSSDDGVQWSADEVDVDAESPYVRTQPRVVAATADSLLVFAQIHLDRTLLMQDRLRDNGFNIELSGIPWDTRRNGDDPMEIMIHGPFGSLAYTTTSDVLGLSDQEVTWLTLGYGEQGQSYVWIETSDSNWRQNTVPIEWVTSVTRRPGGGLLATGWNSSDTPEGAVSTDGTEWNPTNAAAVPTVAERWRNELVGYTIHSPVEVLTSQTGRGWERAGVASIFPSSMTWNGTALGTGPDGLALVAQSREPARRNLEADVPTLVTEEGLSLNVDYENRLLELRVIDKTYTWEMPTRGLESPEGIEVDLESQRVYLNDKSSGERLDSFSFDKLLQAQRDHYARQADISQHHALLFTRDGSEWSVQDLTDEIGSDTSVRLLEQGIGRLTIILDDTSPFNDPGFEIWSAEIP